MISKYYLTEWLFFKKKLLPIFVILSLLFISMTFFYYHYYIDHPDRAKIIAPNYGDTSRKATLYTVNKFTLVGMVFLNNLSFTFLYTLLGFVPFLFLSFGAIVSSSCTIGILFSENEIFLKLDKFSLLMAMSPHGIFEVPAVIYASSIGIYLTIQTSKMIIRKFRSKTPALLTFLTLCEEAGRSFILIVVPLLLIAAFVEVLISLKLFSR
jgi:stage II sporulation protein M